MDRFSFFFAFYGLILGLAITELLSGLARFVRARALRRIDAQTALLAILVFVSISVTWIDAWTTFQDVTLNLKNLWAPILIGTCLFLAASIVFPTDPAEYEDVGFYYQQRKRFVVALLLATEFLVTYTFVPVFERALIETPAVFWLFMLPLNLSLKAGMIALWLAKSRRWNLTWLTALLFLFSVSYWGFGIPALLGRMVTWP